MRSFDVALVGEFNLDILLYGLPSEIAAEREVLASGMAYVLGGSPAITAHNLAALGSRVAFLGAAADDIFAELCRGELAAAGVDLSRMVRAPKDTGTGVSVLLHDGEHRRTVTYPGTTAALTYTDLDLDYLKSSGHLHLSSIFLQQGLAKDAPKLLEEMKQAGLTTSLDPNDDPSGRWSGPIRDALNFTDILMPNEREACALAGVTDLDTAIDRLLEHVPMVVVKRGSQGAIARTLKQSESAPALQVQFTDAVGAGDSFNAGFLHSYLRGLPLRQCVEFGNLAGAFSTTAIGGITAFQNRDKMVRFFQQHSRDVILSG